MLLDWILHNSMGLLDIECESKVLIGRKMCSVLVLVKVLGNTVMEKLKNTSDKVASILSVLFSMLLLKPMSKEELPPDLAIVLHLIKPPNQEELATILAKLAQYLYKHHKHSLQWLYVVPFVHKFQSQKVKSSIEKAGMYMWNDVIDYQVCDNLKELGLADMRYKNVM